MGEKDKKVEKKEVNDGKKGKKEQEEVELSEEDQKLKEELELYVERVRDKDTNIAKIALDNLQEKIRSSTSTMTAVPKPLKFLLPHCSLLLKHYDDVLAVQRSSNEKFVQNFADLLSVIVMVLPGTKVVKEVKEARDGKEEEKKGESDSQEKEDQDDDQAKTSLQYKLQGDPNLEIGFWGHEFVRHLAGEIGVEYTKRSTEDPPLPTDDLIVLVKKIVPFHMNHNAEAEAVDLLMEVDMLHFLRDTNCIDEDNLNRVCKYLLRAALYIEDPEEQQRVYSVAYDLYLSNKEYCDALRIALKSAKNQKDMNTLIDKVFEKCSNPLTRKQMSFIVGRQRAFMYHLDEDLDDYEDLVEYMGNSRLSELFHELAKDLDVLDAKTPDDVYKSQLGGSSNSSVKTHESAKQNAAATFVNAFVNMGFKSDKLISEQEEGDNDNGNNKWLSRNRGDGVLSAAASLGMVFQWDVDEGYGALDGFLYTDDIKIKAGGVLGLGICNAGVYQPDLDPALGMLEDFMATKQTGFNQKDTDLLRSCAIMSYGLAYAGSGKSEVLEAMTEVIEDDKSAFHLVSGAALTLGLTFIGTCDDNAANLLAFRILSASDAELDQPCAKFLSLGLGLLFLGQQDAADAIKSTVETLNHEKMKKYALVVLDSCAYAGTGNVLKVQEMLHKCSEHLDDKDTTSDFQMAAVLGISLITLGEEVGMNMAHRTIEHLIQYGELPIRRAAPVALAMLHISDPEYTVVDTLSKLSHDSDDVVSQAAILSLGFVGAGTNNSRIAKLLRSLSSFYAKKADHLYIVRIAQGLLHLGKGLVTLNPMHSDRFLLNKVALGAILCIFHCAFDPQNTILGQFHYYLYYVAAAANPRMLITVDEECNPIMRSVRVGEAVDTVGQAGNPRTITGFQTHNTPVLLHVHERAEFTNDDYKAESSIIEGVILVQKNEDKEKEKSSK